ncbi:MAG: hypothetical protein QM802_03195 [Agriterribacter sp.]
MKQIIMLVTVLFVLSAGMAQSGDTTTRAAADSNKQQSTFTIGSVYANNANYYGQKSVEKMPYVALAAVYHHRSGFYISAMGYRLLNDSAKFGSAYNVGIGFSFPISKSISGDISYDYSIYPTLSPFLQASNPHNANLTLKRQGMLDFSVSGIYAFGKTNDFFVIPELSKDIDLFNIGNGGLVTLSPSIDLTAGTQHFYNYYLKEKSIRDSLLGLLVPPVFGEPANEEGTTKMTSRFDVLSYNLKLPLSYNRSNLKVEVNAQFSLLSKKAESQPGKINYFFGGAFYYQF